MEHTMSIEIPQLTEHERLTLHDIMTSIALESERIEKYKIMTNMCSRNIEALSGRLNGWKDSFNQRLNEVGLDISRVDIDSDTGRVILDNVTAIQIPEKVNGVSQ
jgi:hypothetical protein